MQSDRCSELKVTRMWPRVSSFLLACGGLFAIAAWLARDRTSKQVKSSPNAQVGQQFADPASSEVRRSSRSKISFTAIASGLTLVFAYLAVAVSAHWFPWQTSSPSIALNLNSGQLSNASWNSNVVDMIDFLDNRKAEVVHLHLVMQSETGQLFSSRTFSYSNQFLYVETKPILGTTDISMGAYCAKTNQFQCSALTVYIVAGPGSNLGYDDGDTAATAYLDGYFQVGEIACQTWICQIDLIPVEPPG
jgi:hypothetical protein